VPGSAIREPPEYLRAGDIARLTGVSLRTARRWIANQILVSGKVGGARLVAKGELERLLSRSSFAILRLKVAGLGRR
jgi:excisionase family DNA binding protein